MTKNNTATANVTINGNVNTTFNINITVKDNKAANAVIKDVTPSPSEKKKD